VVQHYVNTSASVTFHSQKNRGISPWSGRITSASWSTVKKRYRYYTDTKRSMTSYVGMQQVFLTRFLMLSASWSKKCFTLSPIVALYVTSVNLFGGENCFTKRYWGTRLLQKGACLEAQFRMNFPMDMEVMYDWRLFQWPCGLLFRPCVWIFVVIKTNPNLKRKKGLKTCEASSHLSHISIISIYETPSLP